MTEPAARSPDARGRGAVELDDLVAEFRGRHRTIGKSVFELLRQALLQGVFRPGERLRQEELAKRLGVSRIPVRSALLQLESEGLVTFEPYRGATVRTLSVERLREIYALRILLETHVLRRAIRSLSAQQKADVVAEARRLDRSHEGPDFLNERIAFYRGLYDAERNPVTLELIEGLRVSIGRYRLGLRMTYEGFTHEALALAVQRGDARAATALLRSHLTCVFEQMVESLRAGPADE